MPYTYLLLCADKTYYTGSTYDLLTRLSQHRSGEGAEYTKRRLPVKLVYYEEHEQIAMAFWREKKIQGWTHGKKRMLLRDGPGVRVEDDSQLFGGSGG
ncbi:GIY-YIG nuclease family protein [Aeromicrobium sp. S22]|uniref:GIY-YIG nuclease family protein n=1 Tax=Aeromicrobium sp. S22 TaxID=2662029 RepID=UPI00129E8165|nr:GIY-YIG nuclease family protein [Aeromicrobium sp. S22]MRK02435.1 GIY-YIG nuclease family protein [Aeromicrobium sp. S22]